MIARDAFPYVASLLEISGFSQGSIRERRSPDPASSPVDKTTFVIVKVGQTKFVNLHDLFGTTARSPMHHGPFKGCLPFKRLIV